MGRLVRNVLSRMERINPVGEGKELVGIRSRLFAGLVRKRSGVRLRAFSIVEVIIASAIVAIGLTAVLQLLSTSLNTSFRDTEAIVAVELAQEGLEYAYNVRDNNLTDSREAFPASGMFQFPGSSTSDFCAPNVNNPTFVLTGGNQNCFSDTSSPESRFSLAQSGNFFVFQDAITHFARVVSIELDNVAAPTRAEITSIVWWGRSNVRPTGVFPGTTAASVNVSECTRENQCAYVRAILTDWKP